MVFGFLNAKKKHNGANESMGANTSAATEPASSQALRNNETTSSAPFGSYANDAIGNRRSIASRPFTASGSTPPTGPLIGRRASQMMSTPQSGHIGEGGSGGGSSGNRPVGSSRGSFAANSKYHQSPLNNGTFVSYVPEEYRKEVDGFSGFGDFSFAGWAVRVRRMPLSRLETMIREHPALEWNPKYWRGLGKKGTVVDDDGKDLILRVCFNGDDKEKRAYAWFPIDAIELLSPPNKNLNVSRGGASDASKGGPRPGARKGRTGAPGSPGTDAAAAAAAAAAPPAFNVGDTVLRRGELDGPYGVVRGVDETEEEPFLVEWRDRRTDEKQGTSVHKRGDLRRFDRVGERTEQRSAAASAVRPDEEADARAAAAATWNERTAMIFAFYDANGDGYWCVNELNRYLTESDGVPLTQRQFTETCATTGSDPAKGLLLADARQLLRSTDQDISTIHKTVRRLVRQKQAMNPLSLDDDESGGSPARTEPSLAPSPPPRTGASSQRWGGSSAASAAPSVMSKHFVNPDVFWASPERWRTTNAMSQAHDAARAEEYQSP